MNHYHLAVDRTDGQPDFWCGSSMAEVTLTLSQYLDVARASIRPIRGARGAHWCADRTPMPEETQ